MRFVLVLAVGFVVCGLTPPAPAEAAPGVVIRARTDTHLRPVRRRGDGMLTVAGEVVERASGMGVGGLDIEINVAGAPYSAVTRQDGTFEIVAQPSDVPVDVEAIFHGDDRYDASRLYEHDMDPSKAAVDLTLDVAPTPQGVLVTATATVDGVVTEIPVGLRFTGDDTKQPVDVASTTGKQVMLRRAQLGGPGAKRVRARTEGNATRAPATTEKTFELSTTTRTEFTLASADVAFEDSIVARGKVLDEDGAPAPRMPVVLLAGERRLGATMTKADGSWRIDVAADLLGTGRHSLQAAAETTERWRRGSRSGPAWVTIGKPRPAPVFITFAAFAATALIALGFVVGRRRPWRKAEPAAPPSPAQVEIKGGVELARPSLVSTLRRAHDHGFAGVVRDAVRTRRLPGAEVLLTLGAEVRRAVAGDDGAFEIEALPPGDWTARVAAAGHVTEHFTVSIPHRGELRGVRIDLVPVREKIFTLYRRAALPILPSPDLWGIWSPRQIVDHVRGGSPPARLNDLTSFVEECYFSARVPDEDVLPTAEAKVAAALAERAGAPAV